MKTVPQNEWDFSQDRVKKRELPWCFRYEYARSSDCFWERTVHWRKEHKGATKHFAAAIRALRRFAELGLADDFGTLAEVMTILFELGELKTIEEGIHPKTRDEAARKGARIRVRKCAAPFDENVSGSFRGEGR